MKVYLEQFTNETFPDFFSVYLDENGEEGAFGRETRERLARRAVDPDRLLVRGIRRAGSGEILGYCEVQNVEDPEWEIGIYVMERHRFKGVGKAAIPLFLDELASMGRHEFVAKILDGNTASKALFEGVGATCAGVEAVDGFLADGEFERGIEKCKAGADQEELVRLEAVEEIIRGMPSKACLYRIKWPPNA